MAKSNRGILARIFFGLFFVATFPVAGLGFYWLLTLPDISLLAKRNPPTTALMQARSQEDPSSAPRWIWVPMSRISPHLVRAVIVAEDWSFYRHDGFDWEGIREAAAKNLKAGAMKRGGSTITQQVAKNLYLSGDKTLLRKANEALITRLLERDLSKQRILEIYLNVAEWGRNVYGAEAAARHHFQKSAADLTAEEAALLAAILPSPRSYDPLKITRYLTVRQQQILRHMVREAKLTKR